MNGRPTLRDPGAQAERTLLAWTRTCVAQGAVVILLLRLTAERPSALVAVVPLLLAAFGLHLAARRRYHQVSSGSDQPAGRLLAALTVVAVTVAAACALTVLV